MPVSLPDPAGSSAKTSPSQKFSTSTGFSPNASKKQQDLQTLSTKLAAKGLSAGQQKRVIADSQNVLSKLNNSSGITGFGSNLASDVTSSLSNTIRGIPNLAGAAYRTAKSSVEDTNWADPSTYVKLNPVIAPALVAANQVAKQVGHPLPKFLQPTGGQEGNVRALGGGFQGNASKQDQKRYPVLVGQGQSFRNTANRATDPGKLLSDYYHHPFSTAAEDAANLSVVAAPLAKGLEAGGLVKAGSAVAKANEAFKVVGQGPFLPVSGTARVANKVLGKVGEAASSLKTVQKAQKVLHLDPESKALRTKLMDTNAAAPDAYLRASEVNVPQMKLLPKQAEQDAMREVQAGNATEHARVRKAVGQEKFDQIIRDEVGTQGTLSVEGANLAADIAEGKAGELSSRVDQAIALQKKALPGRQDPYLEGPVTRQEQVGTKLLSKVVDPAQKTADRLTKIAEDAKRAAADAARVHELSPSNEAGNRADLMATRAQKAESKALGAREHLTQVMNSTEAAPSRFRPGLEMHRALQKAVTDHAGELRKSGLIESADQLDRVAKEIPTTVDAFVAAGLNPDHFITPEPIVAGLKSSGRIGRRAANLTTGEEVGRSTNRNLVYDRSIPAQAQAESRRAVAVMQNQTADWVRSQQYAGRLGEKGTPLEGIVSPEQAAQKGFASLDSTATPESVYVPVAIKKSFDAYFGKGTPNGFENLLQHTYDPATNLFKMSVLSLSPSWNVGNAVGNSFLAAVGAGEIPIGEVFKIVNEARKTGLTGAKAKYGTGALYGKSAARESLGKVLEHTAPEGRISRTLKAIPRVGYTINKTVDDIGRTAVYMAKERKGYSPELATKMALRAMGDFSRMNQFEQSTLRRIIPFYAWQKHITKLAFSLPIEHPIRTAWTMQLANQYGQSDEWVRALPSYLQGVVPLGGGNVLNVSNLFPFPTDPTESLTPGGLARSTNPIIKSGVGLATGFNLSTGRDFTSRPGSGKIGPFGNELPNAPSVLEQLRGISPQARLFDTLSGRKDVARYNSGETVLTTDPKTGKRVPIPTPQNKGQALLKFFGVPIQSEKDLLDQAQSIQRNKVKVLNSREDYTRQRKVSKKLFTASKSGSGSGISLPDPTKK